MKVLLRKFRDILSSECLNENEKNYLQKEFRKFLDQRELLARPSITDESEIEEDQTDWILNT